MNSLLRGCLALLAMAHIACGTETGPTGEATHASTRASTQVSVSEPDGNVPKPCPSPSLTSDASASGSAPAPAVANDSNADGLTAEIDGTTYQFTRDVFAYNGRPPSVEIWAATESDAALPGWASLRVFLFPKQGMLTAADYPCQSGNTFIILMGPKTQYSTNEVGAQCTIQLTEPGTQIGELFAGTFDALLRSSDGKEAAISRGTFRGTIR